MNNTPLYQTVTIRGEDMEAGECVFPNYTITYGNNECEVQYPKPVPIMPDHIAMGPDIIAYMETPADVPEWSVMKSGVGVEWGRLTMKDVDWQRWFTCCFQTVILIGKATPGQGNVRQQKRNIVAGSQLQEQWSAAVTSEEKQARKRGWRNT